MEPSNQSSSIIVDIEKGLSSTTNDPYESSFNDSPPSPRPSKVATPILSPFSGLKQLFDRNPSTVVSGRYTINFRQMLILVLILMSLTSLWIISSANADSPGVTTEGSHLTSAVPQLDRPKTNPPPALNKPSKPMNNKGTPVSDIPRERYERVRGKYARSGLKKIQFQFPEESEKDRIERESRLKAVRDGFEHAWNGYKKHAWGHDEVRPVSGGFADRFNGWGATMVDSLDTLVIMGFNKEFDEAIEWIKTSFNMRKNPTDQLPFFETIIRYLGGFLSAYDLTGEEVLLEKAEELGGYMLNAFQSSDFPSGRVTVEPSANRMASYRFVLAEVGTIQLEFSRLSMLLSNPIFDQKGQKVFEILGTATSDLPGLLPDMVSSTRGQHYTNFRAHVGGMTDSYYEYLLKEWILLDGKPTQYKNMFLQAVDSIEKYMVLKPNDGSTDSVLLGTVTSGSKDVDPVMEHLACFMAGSLAMGGKYFDRPNDIELAKKVAQNCFLGYKKSATGIGPETMRFDRSITPGTYATNSDTYYNRQSSGTSYILRPETLESLWILYRLTGEKKYQDQAWEIFKALEENCRTDIAYSGLHNVNSKGSYDDRMESFFMAETMKYLYLMFSTPDVISLDDFVFNTEAHPLVRS